MRCNRSLTHICTHEQLEAITAQRALIMWDGMGREEQLSHPPAIRALFEPGSILRTQYEAFANGGIGVENPQTGECFPTRNAGGNPSPELEYHLYRYCGVMTKANSIPREQKFSILGNYVSAGARNASLERLSAQLLQADDYPSEVSARTCTHAHTGKGARVSTHILRHSSTH